MTRRHAATLALLAPLTTLGGCEWLRNMTQPDKKSTTADGPVQPKTSEQLVGYLNQESAKLTAVASTRVNIDARIDGQTFTLGDSTLTCAKPKYFSLVGGKKLLSDLVIAGSNTEEFWVYSKFPEAQYIYCSHADFQRGAGQLPFPFDPNWALEALGMGYYDPNRPYRVDIDQAAREHRLSYQDTTPQGTTVTRTVVFASEEAPDGLPQVRRHAITDANGQPIAVADVKKVVVKSVGKAGEKEVRVQVPTLVVLEWTRQKSRVELRLGSPQVNAPISDADKLELFSRPKISGVTPVNLTSLQGPRGATPGDLPRRKFKGE